MIRTQIRNLSTHYPFSMYSSIQSLLSFIESHNGIDDKSRLSKLVEQEFGLTKDRSVFYCDEFSIRFCYSSGRGFSNTVLSLSNLIKYDNKPFLVCLVTPSSNQIFLANSTFLRKISHSSQELRVNNIKGSFNGSDILREFEGINNSSENILRLFEIHHSVDFSENLIRLVEATNNISPSGTKFSVNDSFERIILNAPERAIKFVQSPESLQLKEELDAKVDEFKNEILLASLIENVNIRGRIIEYLIASQDETLRRELINSLQSRSSGVPQLRTENALGDYQRIFDGFLTETDVKTKIMILNSNPKAYNIDKMLEFLAQEKTVFMFYFVGVDPARIINTVLVSMFQRKLLQSTILLRHWSGRNSRGVTQFEGKTIKELILSPESNINEEDSKAFLEKVIAL
jgi:hypothetical protein